MRWPATRVSDTHQLQRLSCVALGQTVKEALRRPARLSSALSVIVLYRCFSISGRWSRVSCSLKNGRWNWKSLRERAQQNNGTNYGAIVKLSYVGLLVTWSILKATLALCKNPGCTRLLSVAVGPCCRFYRLARALVGGERRGCPGSPQHCTERPGALYSPSTMKTSLLSIRQVGSTTSMSAFEERTDPTDRST